MQSAIAVIGFPSQTSGENGWYHPSLRHWTIGIMASIPHWVTLGNERKATMSNIIFVDKFIHCHKLLFPSNTPNPEAELKMLLMPPASGLAPPGRSGTFGHLAKLLGNIVLGRISWAGDSGLVWEAISAEVMWRDLKPTDLWMGHLTNQINNPAKLHKQFNCLSGNWS